MNASTSHFRAQKSSSRFVERLAFGLFRSATYLILICAAFIFGTIFYKGGGTVFQTKAPFINIPFLTESPETLFVFEYDGVQKKMGDKEFRKFKETVGMKDIPAESFVYSSGGIWPCILGTVLLVVGSMVIALTIGICSAIYLNEYSKHGRFVHFIRLAILNLAGVPSIVFGLFGVGLFVIFMPVLQNFDNPSSLTLPLGFGYFLNFSGWNVCLLSGWFTLAFMALPVVITASEESLKAVPMGLREGSLALGATKWQSIRTNVLPYALPGMLTSAILGIARVAGETAPIMFTAAYVVRDHVAWDFHRPFDFLFQGVMALPYHIYVVSSKIPQNEYTERVQYGTALVFLIIVMGIASSSVVLRNRARRRYRW